MNHVDLRSTRLEWIRDGSNWLVGVGTGALVLSGTYFFDRFDRAPSAAGLLIAAWILLALSALAGIFTSFSAWKDLKAADHSNAALGGWVRHSYTVMMWTFLLGYLCLAVALILSVIASGRSGPGSREPELFAVGQPFPPFPPGSAAPLGDALVRAVCGARKALEEADAIAVIVVGRNDRRELLPEVAAKFGSNAALAQQRAELVRTLLADKTLCKSREVSAVLTLIGGPRHAGQPAATADTGLADDRRVEVYGFRATRPSRRPAVSGD